MVSQDQVRELERLLERGAVLLEPEPARLTEYGKRFFDRQNVWVSKFGDVWKDIAKLAEAKLGDWDAAWARVKASQDPVMASGLSQYAMPKLLDHIVGKTSFTLPATVALALGTAAPASATTGVWANECTAGGYVTYSRFATTEATWTSAATAADPSQAKNATTINFADCTGTGATLLGFLVTDNDSLNTGNALWFGPLASTTISTVQTPPTIAANAMTLQIAST